MIKIKPRRCAICRKHIPRSKKYCSDSCSDKADWIRRRKRIAETKPEKLCKNCGNIITLKKRRSFCSEDCYDAFNLDVRRSQYTAKNKQKTCEICGDIFIWTVGREPSTCKNKQCRNTYMNKKGRDKWGNMPQHDRLKKIDAIDRYIKKKDGEVISAKCPGCGKMHKHRFIPAWIGNGTPRIGCINYPYCARSAHEYDGDPTNLSNIFQSDNRAYA